MGREYGFCRYLVGEMIGGKIGGLKVFSPRTYEKSINLIQDLFGWRNFKEDGKDKRKNGRENDFCGCLVGEMKGEKTGGTYGSFSLGPPKINPPNCGWQGAKWKMTHPLLLLCTCQFNLVGFYFIYLLFLDFDAYNTCILLFYNEHVILLLLTSSLSLSLFFFFISSGKILNYYQG